MFSFAVLGDTHIVREESHWDALHLGWPGGITELSDLARNGWMTKHVLPAVLTEIERQAPDFVLHTGDVIPGHCDTSERQAEETREAYEILGRLQVPVFFSNGSHDGVLGKGDEAGLIQVVYPYLSKQLGRPCERSYYDFSGGGCRFISVDYTTWGEDQYSFLESRLRKAEDSDEFVIVFGHPPVVPIARPFFTGPSYARDLAHLSSKYRVHIYFCGHTHNHAASVHRFGEKETAQLMSTPLGYPDVPPVPLTDVRPLLPDPQKTRYGWGYLEDTVSGWWHVRVKETELTAQWFALGRGLQGEVRVPKLGPAQFVRTPGFPSSRRRLPDLSQVRRARIRLAGSGDLPVNIERMQVNGHTVTVPFGLVYFDSRQFVDIPQRMIPELREENVIRFSLNRPCQTVGAMVMELLLKDGSVIRSETSRYVTSNPAHHEADPEMFSMVDVGDPISVKLSFGDERPDPSQAPFL